MFGDIYWCSHPLRAKITNHWSHATQRRIRREMTWFMMKCIHSRKIGYQMPHPRPIWIAIRWIAIHILNVSECRSKQLVVRLLRREWERSIANKLQRNKRRQCKPITHQGHRQCNIYTVFSLATSTRYERRRRTSRGFPDNQIICYKTINLICDKLSTPPSSGKECGPKINIALNNSEETRCSTDAVFSFFESKSTEHRMIRKSLCSRCEPFSVWNSRKILSWSLNAVLKLNACI